MTLSHTPRETGAYTWHTDALAGRNPPVHESEIQCGWFVKRTEYRGPLMPCRIFWEPQLDADGETLGDDILRCEVAGQRRDPTEEWIWLAKLPISQDEYFALMAEMFMAEKYQGPQRAIKRWLEEQPNVHG